MKCRWNLAIDIQAQFSALYDGCSTICHWSSARYACFNLIVHHINWKQTRAALTFLEPWSGKIFQGGWMLQHLPSQPPSNTQFVIYVLSISTLTLTELVLVNMLLVNHSTSVGYHGFTQWDGIWERTILMSWLAVHSLTTIDIKYKGMITTPCKLVVVLFCCFISVHHVCFISHSAPCFGCAAHITPPGGDSFIDFSITPL